MHIDAQAVLFIFAFVLFVIAALGVDSKGYNLIGAGLACAVAGFLFA